MKRILIATALTTTLSTAAFAVTDGQMNQIQTFAPGIDVTSMTETQLEVAYGIVTSGDSHGEKMGELRALTLDDEPAQIAVISEAQWNRLMSYAPEADPSVITQAQAESALAITYSGMSAGERRQQVQEILNDYSVVETMTDKISEGRLNLIKTYVPEIQEEELSDQDVQVIISVIHSGMSRAEITSQIKSIMQS